MRPDPTVRSVRVRLRHGLLGAALVLLTATATMAQTTGSINGTVVDNTGAVLPGVTVTATSPALMGVQTADYERNRQLPVPVRSSGCLPAHLRALRILQRQARGHRGQPRIHRDGQRAAASGVAAGNRHRLRRVAGGRRLEHHEHVQPHAGHAAVAAQRARHLVGDGAVAGRPRLAHRRRRVAGRHADRLRGVRLLRSGAHPDRRRQHHRRHRQRRLLLRLRLVRRAAARKRRQRRAGGDAGRAAERGHQIGRQPDSRHALQRLPERAPAGHEHRRPAGRRSASARARGRSTTTTSTATSAARSSATSCGTTSRCAARTARSRSRASRSRTPATSAS